ncbi:MULTISPECIES: ferredoxin reductase [Micromonospora]|uniref:Oxidoreductase n=1 Tax=Micromonospora maris TaxID=1003110 RepID=A0A9X0I1S4_9ACTN|nr:MULTISPECIES: ferredoxin reductase [Micromonospora]AEB45792.1 oxidoreductase FAD/NAD(P)-binding domain-containing protein [Micromonospora maris AB-18-032]KUJ45124.1 oxidoreductase [Micromonospora maris]RUL94832.1 oxidoreductase [Verrucosispora sp. FIM060022]
MRWQPARLVSRRVETATAQTLVLEVPDWPGHLPGQHVDIRLTAPDGYQAARSYSLAGPADGDRIEVTVQRVPDGEVSPFLVDGYQVGDPVEVRGPLGGWFIWRPQQTEPVLLVAGGSGVVPLMAMIRARRAAGSRVPFRLIYSVRTPDDVFYAEELRQRVRDDAGLDVAYVYTREAPEQWPDRPHRIGLADVNTHGWPPELEPRVYVCGPTGFVETVADLLVGLGHPARLVRTERFGPTG